MSCFECHLQIPALKEDIAALKAQAVERDKTNTQLTTELVQLTAENAKLRAELEEIKEKGWIPLPKIGSGSTE